MWENRIDLNDVELVHRAFQLYAILPLLCVLALFVLESLMLKLQLKILIYLLKKITVIYSGSLCKLVLHFPSLL